MAKNLLITELQKLGDRARSQQKRGNIIGMDLFSATEKKSLSPKNSLICDRSPKRPRSPKSPNNKTAYAKNLLPKLMEQSKINFLDHMINVETKFANLREIEKYFQGASQEINTKFNLNGDKISTKNKYLKELNLKIENEVAEGGKIEASDIHFKYKQMIRNISTKM